MDGYLHSIYLNTVGFDWRRSVNLQRDVNRIYYLPLPLGKIADNIWVRKRSNWFLLLLYPQQALRS